MSQQTGKLRVAIAGCHRMVTPTPGSHNWASAFAAVPETQIVAVFDHGSDTRAAFLQTWGQVAEYDDYIRMLREVRPDIVCIATRQTMHADQCERAIAAGVRGILIDKPLATSMEEADRILSVCRQSGVPLALCLDRRWMTSYNYLRSLIAGGAIGEPTTVLAYGVPNLINHGCHWYDVVLLLSGDAEPIWVSGLVDDVSADPPTSRRPMDPPGRGQIGFANGVTAYISPDGGPSVAFEVLGTRGRLLILNDARTVTLWTQESDTYRNLIQRPLEMPAEAEGWPSGPTIVQDLARAVREGGRTACDVEQARRATEIGFAFHVSNALSGTRVSLPLTDRSLQIVSFPWGNE